jgi:hypothetical protein
MEKKNNFMPLLIYSIKEKKNWVLLSTVIIFLTTLVIPYILRADNEFFIMFGIFELFVLILINCLVDNSFLHNESKLTYYMSKPVPLSRQIMINIVANTVFTVYLLVLIIVSVLIQDVDNEILRVFKMLIPWLSAIILLSSLSSVLSGNTLMAGAITIFNFCLPLIILLVTMFIFTILENVVVLGDIVISAKNVKSVVLTDVKARNIIVESDTNPVKIVYNDNVTIGNSSLPAIVTVQK